MTPTVLRCPRCGTMQPNQPRCGACDARLTRFIDPTVDVTRRDTVRLAGLLLAFLGGIVVAGVLTLALLYALM